MTPDIHDNVGSFLFFSKEIAKKCLHSEINVYLCTKII